MDAPLRFASLADLDAVMSLEEAGFPAGIVEDRAVFSRRISTFPEGFLLAGDPAWGYFCTEVWSGWDAEDPHRFDLGHDIASYLDRAGDTLYVASMTVAPANRGTGRGRALFRAGIDAMVTQYPGLRRAVLIVNEHWHGARRIYEAEGFQVTGGIPEFFRPDHGETGSALIMNWETGLH